MLMSHTCMQAERCRANHWRHSECKHQRTFAIGELRGGIQGRKPVCGIQGLTTVPATDLGMGRVKEWMWGLTFLGLAGELLLEVVKEVRVKILPA